MPSSVTLASKAGAIVRQKREAADLSTRELAKMAGLGGNDRVVKIEHGEAVTLANLEAIARALGCSVRDLLP